jgi:hypothetical protein
LKYQKRVLLNFTSMSVLITQFINFFSHSSFFLCVHVCLYIIEKKMGLLLSVVYHQKNNSHINSLEQCIQMKISVFRFWEVNTYDSNSPTGGGHSQTKTTEGFLLLYS